MQPLMLTLKGFRGIRDGLGFPQLTLDLERLAGDAQLIAIAGPNGSGKTTVMDNLTPYNLLASRAAVGALGGLSYYDHVYLPESMKDLVWAHEGRSYRSQIVIRLNGRRKTEAFLHHLDDDGSWRPVVLEDGTLSDGRIESYTACVEHICGSAETFFTSLFAPEGKAAAQHLPQGRNQDPPGRPARAGGNPADRAASRRDGAPAQGRACLVTARASCPGGGIRPNRYCPDAARRRARTRRSGRSRQAVGADEPGRSPGAARPSCRQVRAAACHRTAAPPATSGSPSRDASEHTRGAGAARAGNGRIPAARPAGAARVGAPAARSGAPAIPRAVPAPMPVGAGAVPGGSPCGTTAYAGAAGARGTPRHRRGLPCASPDAEPGLWNRALGRAEAGNHRAGRRQGGAAHRRADPSLQPDVRGALRWNRSAGTLQAAWRRPRSESPAARCARQKVQVQSELAEARRQCQAPASAPQWLTWAEHREAEASERA